jgi:Vilmaviridae nuclease
LWKGGGYRYRKDKRLKQMPSDPFADKALYPSDNAYGIPNLRYAAQSQIPDWLIPYRTRVRAGQSVVGGAVHFFLFDAFFESVWNCPAKSGRYLERFSTVLTPDFSLNADMPLAVQIWNTYRNRWCGVHWQTQGFHVIPTVSWSTEESYDFCFLGIAPYSIVAVMTIGSRSPHSRHLFLKGFSAMLEQIQPGVVLCYGKPFSEMEALVELKIYPDRWETIRKARAGQMPHGW